MRKKKLCFVSMSFPPEFLGGTNLFHKNLIKYIHSKHKNIIVSWVYFGKENKRDFKDEVNYIELKVDNFFSSSLFWKGLMLNRFFKKNYFDVINARTGFWIHLYPKKKNQRIVQTFHGTRFYFNKNHYKRLNLIKKTLLLVFLSFNWITDMPSKKSDKLICVSEKVKKQVQKLYGKRKNIVVIRTGVDLKNFKVRNKNKIKEKLGFDKENSYGLYIGRGGYWTKGLDRAINLSEEIYKKNKKYRLIVIGSDLKKVKHLIDKKFVIYVKEVEREKMMLYYNVADVFFCLSRYEGGSPTLVVSEAMASGCLLVCSKDSEQEIIKDEKNGLIIKEFGKKEAKEILDILDNKKKKEEIIKNSTKTIKEISLEKWGERYLDALMK